MRTVLEVYFMQFDKRAYDAEFQRRAYDDIRLRVPKGCKAVLQQIADDNGLSVTRLIIEALEDRYNIDLHSRRTSRDD